jgi:hypothetical protein
MRQLRDRHGFHWLDYNDAMELSDADFRDVDHLNPQGVHKLSKRLGQDLAQLPRLDSGAPVGLPDTVP